MKKLRIFVSSVQKEQEVERVALAGWVSADPQLSECCDVVLFEQEPLTGQRISKPYLESLKSCQIYLLILDCEYGNPPEFSATHEEYPREAVREAIVNAIAHRNYEDRTRQILVKLFVDRLEILSPGEPLKPLTVAKIKRGNCLPCSRNPIIGQHLNHLRLMDQRGSGIGRMKTAMLNHGLTAPTYDLVDGYFRVTLKGPDENLDQLRVPEDISAGIPLAVEEQLNDRQKEIIKHISLEGFVTSGWCRKKFKVTYNTTYRDLSALVSLEILTPTGRGRSTRYVPKGESL